jgi:integral membrane protein
MLLIKPTNVELYKQLLYPIGMSHGVLFMGYIGFAIILKKAMQWNAITFLIILLASLLPFGTFYVDKKYLS